MPLDFAQNVLCMDPVAAVGADAVQAEATSFPSLGGEVTVWTVYLVGSAVVQNRAATALWVRTASMRAP
jgi:hypothetical protein